jgi:hypothetical protein
MSGGLVRPRSAGCQPAAFGSFAECTFARTARSQMRTDTREDVRGRLPRTTGWQLVIPKKRNAKR